MPTLLMRIKNQYAKVECEKQGNLYIFRSKYHKEVVQELKSLEGAKWEADQLLWTAPDTERNQYTFARWKDPIDPRYDVPISPITLKQLSNVAPLAHQADLIQETMGRQAIIGAHEMGLGKTLSGYILMHQVEGRFLLVAPNTPMRTWRGEILKWNLPFQVGDHFVPCSPAGLVKYVRTVPISSWPTNLIVDEVHNFKNPDAQQTQALFIFAEYVRKKGGKILLLSGTIQPKNMGDLWSYCEICQPGYLRESTKDKLTKRLMHYEIKQNANGRTYPVFSGWKKDEILQMYNRLGTMIHVRSKKDCTDLPPKIYQVIESPCSRTDLSACEMILAKNQNTLTALEQLRQLSDGFSYKTGANFTSPKETAVKEWIDQVSPNRLVLYAGYYASIDKLIALVKSLGYSFLKIDGRGEQTDIPSKDPLTVFQQKEEYPFPVAYIGHPDSGGVGLNLQASEYCLFYSNSFKGASRWQAEDRIYRIGSTGSTIVDFTWLPTDKYILKNLQAKRDLQSISLGELTEWTEQNQKNYLESESEFSPTETQS